MTAKEKKQSKMEIIKELADQKHSDIRFITEGNIPGSSALNEVAIATYDGLFFYKYQDQELTLLDEVLWEEVHSGKVDFLALSTILTLNGEDYKLNNEGKYVFRLAQQRSGIQFEKVDRKWHQKILGFRSGVRWKQVTAIIGYLLMISILSSIFGNGSVATFLMFLITFAIIFSIVALIKGSFLFFGIPNRKVAGIIIGAGFLVMMVFPITETASESDYSENASEQIEAEQADDTETEKTKKAAEKKEEAEKQKQEEKEAAQKAEVEQKAKEKEKEAEDKAKEAAATQQQEEKSEKAAAKKALEEKKEQEAVQQAKEQAKAEKVAKEKQEAEAKAAAEKKKKESQANATVTRVVDGDTIEVNMDGKQETIRLLLVDTPETVHPNEPVQPFGPEASQFVKNILTGEEVRVKVGSEERDNYGRLLAYVFIDGETIQEKLLREGLARTAYLYNDLTMLDEFHEAQQTALNAGKGVWSISGYAHVDHDHGYHYQEEPDPVPEPTPAPAPETAAPESNVYYKNCTAVRDAGANPVRTGDPGYGRHLDRDGDGVGCE